MLTLYLIMLACKIIFSILIVISTLFIFFRISAFVYLL